ncbi:MAG: DNA polymerase I [Pelagibacterales bacterium]|nr:DNA polymerase I [Pelagibacterales bacterium]
MTNSKKTDLLYLIDGSGYIFRAFYALPPLTRKSDGMPVGAVSGFCNMLYKFLEDAKLKDGYEKPTHLAVIFDSARKNFRNNIYPEYKANRNETPEDLIPQFSFIREAVKAFNLPSIEMENYEADDLIATYKKEALKKNIRVKIISSDKDLMQLIDDQTTLFDSMKNKDIGIEEVKEKFGVTPDKVIEVQALAGDSSDNIPGVPSIGVKTAAELINEFGSVENLLKNVDKIKQPKRRQTISDNKENALISKKLVTLKDDVPTVEKIEDFLVKDLNKEKIVSFLKKMEFTRLLERIEKTYGLSTAKKDIVLEESKDSVFTSTDVSRKNYKTVFKLSELEKILEEAEKKGLIVVDVETDSLNIRQANLVGISFCVKEGNAYYVPLNHSNKEDKQIKSQLNTELVIKKIKPFLEDKSIKKIGHNIKYDFRILKKYGIHLNPIEDTMLMSYVLDAGINRHGMDLLSEIHLHHKTISFKDVAGIGKSQVTFDKVNINQATEYAAEDADVTLRLYNFFNTRIFKEEVLSIYEELEKPMIQVLSQMEENGVKIDEKILKNLSLKFEKDLKVLEKKIYELAGEEFNIASTKQLGDILYKKLKIIATKKTKKGNYATNVNILEDLAFQGHELPKLILDWRQKSKLKNTYTDSLQEFIDSKTKRIHTSFLLAATNTGRLASSDPNIQNIPIKSAEGKEIRSAFIAEKGNFLISADYSQIEMRILAHMADVKELKKGFLNSEDIHNITAAQIFEVKHKDINEEMRRKAKAINFGIIYGISSYGLAKQISVSNVEAETFLKSYFKKFPEIKDYMNETLKNCRKYGYVKTLFGRKCNFPNINDKNHTLRTFQERASINAPIQGTAADLLRLAMIKIDQKIQDQDLQCKMLLQIHDELVFETSADNIKKSKIDIVEIMSKASEPNYKFSIPLSVDIKEGLNWTTAH